MARSFTSPLLPDEPRTRRMWRLIGQGERFGRLVVLGDAGRSKAGARLLRCACDCGRETVVRSDALRTGNTKSCGCLHRSHGHSHAVGRSASATYCTWAGMLRRCSNPRSDCYERYGGRGIAVCECWRTFENFLADMGERPEGKTIDRIDNDGNYEPGNCRWATPTEQQANKPPRVGRVQRVVIQILALTGAASAEQLAYHWPTLTEAQAHAALHGLYNKTHLVEFAGMATSTRGRECRTYELSARGRDIADQMAKEESWDED